MNTRIFVSSRCVGVVHGDTFKKTIKGSKHILHTPPALALAVESLEQAKRAGARQIVVTDAETGRVYRVSLEYFYKHSFNIRRGGFEPQLALPLDHWEVTTAGGDAVSNKYKQSSLFSQREFYEQPD